MEFANDLMAALRSRLSPEADGTGNTGLDWPGLHARLVAAHAARAELARSESRTFLLDGGFADWSHTVDFRENGECAVNPADSTDGKGPHAIAEVIAGQDMAGGRGQ
ncbi:MAG: hypothetical protein U1E37_05770 [Sphingomonadaceae bacterium]